jgi:hypothetical protein
MKIQSIKRLLAVALLVAAVPIGVLRGQQSTIASSSQDESLKEFLRNYLNPGRLVPDKTTRITAVSVKTKTEAAVEVLYVSGQHWCGSGGCTLLILEPHGTSFRVLGRVSIVQLPVRLLPSTNNGYPDFGVRVKGLGNQAGYEAELSFNGATYPKNPSISPAQHLSRIEGKEIIATTEHSVLLYD